MILPVGISRLADAPPSDLDADRIDLGPMDLPAHHTERPARDGADRPDVPLEPAAR